MKIGSMVRRRGGSDYYELVRYDLETCCWYGRTLGRGSNNFSTLPLEDFPECWEELEVEVGVVYVSEEGVEFEVLSWDLELVWTCVVRGMGLFNKGDRIGHEWLAFEELKRRDQKENPEGYSEGYLRGETGLRWL